MFRAGYPRAPLAVEPGLTEQDLGDWQGLPHAALPPLLTRPAHAFWPLAANESPPGGESMAEVVLRVGATLERLAIGHAGADVVVVSHGGAIRAAVAHALRITADNALHLRAQPVADAAGAPPGRLACGRRGRDAGVRGEASKARALPGPAKGQWPLGPRTLRNGFQGATAPWRVQGRALAFLPCSQPPARSAAALSPPRRGMLRVAFLATRLHCPCRSQPRSCLPTVSTNWRSAGMARCCSTVTTSNRRLPAQIRRVLARRVRPVPSVRRPRHDRASRSAPISARTRWGCRVWSVRPGWCMRSSRSGSCSRRCAPTWR